MKDRTFFFGSLLRWTDHRFTSGRSIAGVPTVEGQGILRSIAGNRPQVRALLEHLPAAQVPTGARTTVTVDGQSVDVPLGTLSGAASTPLDVWQSSARVDHRIGNAHTVGGRYLFDDRYSIGGQPVPSGLTDQVSPRRQAASTFINSFLPRRFNELRVSYQRIAGDRSVVDRKAENIPTIEIEDLGLSGFNPDPTRTAIGAATVLPMFSHMNNYHLSDVLGILLPSHSLKAGIDLRRAEQFYFLGLGDRGRMRYSTLQRFVDDIAEESQIAVTSGSRLDGVFHFRYYDVAFFFQDEWRARPNLTLTYGVRYESPGTPSGYLVRLNKQILADHNNDPAFVFEPVPKRDTNNWAPRFGFNYRFGQWPGLLRAFTGQGQLVMRGGYSRAYDQSFNQIFQTIALGFPFIPNIRPESLENAFTTLQGIRSGLIVPAVTPVTQVRHTVGADFRAPAAEQFSLQFQRELASDWAMTLGWIGAKGTGLFQVVDENPTLAGNNNNGTLRVDPSRGVVRLRCNCASSIYHSLQSSLEKRFSAGFSMAAHYTWSTFIDDASEIFNASNNGDVAVSQDSFNRHAERGRSTYDRPHRLAVNGVLELPFMRNTEGVLGHFFGGWQISGFLTLQSGGPFSPLNGADPGFRLTGISGQVGNAIRPNLNTTLDVSRMSVEEIIRAGGRNLFSQVTRLNPIGNAGRNILRADGINRVDFGINKTLKFTETNRLQFRAEFYNLFNSRDFGIPQALVSNPGFGVQWNTDGGNRRIVVGLRYTF